MTDTSTLWALVVLVMAGVERYFTRDSAAVAVAGGDGRRKSRRKTLRHHRHQGATAGACMQGQPHTQAHLGSIWTRLCMQRHSTIMEPRPIDALAQSLHIDAA